MSEEPDPRQEGMPVASQAAQERAGEEEAINAARRLAASGNWESLALALRVALLDAGCQDEARLLLAQVHEALGRQPLARRVLADRVAHGIGEEELLAFEARLADRLSVHRARLPRWRWLVLGVSLAMIGGLLFAHGFPGSIMPELTEIVFGWDPEWFEKHMIWLVGSGGVLLLTGLVQSGSFLLKRYAYWRRRARAYARWPGLVGGRACRSCGLTRRLLGRCVHCGEGHALSIQCSTGTKWALSLAAAFMVLGGFLVGIMVLVSVAGPAKSTETATALPSERTTPAQPATDPLAAKPEEALGTSRGADPEMAEAYRDLVSAYSRARSAGTHDPWWRVEATPKEWTDGFSVVEGTATVNPAITARLKNALPGGGFVSGRFVVRGRYIPLANDTGYVFEGNRRFNNALGVVVELPVFADRETGGSVEQQAFMAAKKKYMQVRQERVSSLLDTDSDTAASAGAKREEVMAWLQVLLTSGGPDLVPGAIVSPDIRDRSVGSPMMMYKPSPGALLLHDGTFILSATYVVDAELLGKYSGLVDDVGATRADVIAPTIGSTTFGNGTRTPVVSNRSTELGSTSAGPFRDELVSITVAPSGYSYGTATAFSVNSPPSRLTKIEDCFITILLLSDGERSRILAVTIALRHHVYARGQIFSTALVEPDSQLLDRDPFEGVSIKLLREMTAFEQGGR